MHTIIRLTGLVLLWVLSTSAARDAVPQGSGSPDGDLWITIIYDNYPGEKNLGTDWGYACLVQFNDEKLLFDTGRETTLLQKNMSALGITPEEIPALFISHFHQDHTAGIPWILDKNPSVNCYLPAGYADELRSNGKLPPNGKGVSSPAHLYGPFYSTGDDFKNFREQGLVIKSDDGGVLITGCSHPGIIDMVRVAREELGIEVHTVIGGLHLLQTPEDQVRKIAEELKQMGIHQVCATHCTGDRPIVIFRETFGEGYLEGGSGREIHIEL